MSVFFFYFFAALLVLAALSVVLHRNPLYNVLSLVVAIFSLSALFMQMEAYFVGVILLLVYAGAVIVFFLFVVMCLNLHDPVHTPLKQNRFRLLGGLVGVLLLAEFFIATKAFLAVRQEPFMPLRGTIEAIGKVLFTEYLLPFELTSFLLFIAIFGIVSLAQGTLDTVWVKEQDMKRAENS